MNFFLLFLTLIVLKANAETLIEDEAPVQPVFSESQQKELEESQEGFEFQAEVSRLMDIIINSLYKTKVSSIRGLCLYR